PRWPRRPRIPRAPSPHPRRHGARVVRRGGRVPRRPALPRCRRRGRGGLATAWRLRGLHLRGAAGAAGPARGGALGLSRRGGPVRGPASARPRRGGGALGLPRGARQGRGRGRERRQLHAAAGGGRRCDVGEGGQVLLGGGGHRWRDGGPDHLLRHGRLLRLPAGGPPPAGQGEEAAGDGLASAGRRAGTGAGRARVRGRRLCDRLHRHLAARSRARLARGDSAPLLLPSVPLWFVLAACCTPPPRPTARG
ncbi:unnamed protein product, partial [Prorocentrum cordatum]